METQVEEKRGITLEDICISPGPVETVLAELRRLYPGAYRLREAVENPIVIPNEGKNLVYAIQHDDDYNYPKYSYVLWNGMVFGKIVSNKNKARCISEKGLFFLSEEDTWHKVVIDHDAIFPAAKNDHYLIVETHEFHIFNRMIANDMGIFIEGRAKDSSELNVSFLSFSNRYEMFHFPAWADAATWQPGEDDTVYFSDETSIYHLEAGRRKEPIKVMTTTDPNVRFGKTDEWVVTSSYNVQMQLFESVKISKAFLVLDKQHGSGYSSNGYTLPYSLNYQGFNRCWIPFHQGFVEIHDSGTNIDLYYYFLKNEVWEWERFISIEGVYYSHGRLFPKNTDSFVLGVKEQRYLFTWDMIKAELAL